MKKENKISDLNEMSVKKKMRRKKEKTIIINSEKQNFTFMRLIPFLENEGNNKNKVSPLEARPLLWCFLFLRSRVQSCLLFSRLFKLKQRDGLDVVK